MIHDIFSGFVNRVNGYSVFVMDVSPEFIELMVMKDDTQFSSERYAVEDFVLIGDKSYRVTELFKYISTPGHVPPGKDAGQMVARIRSQN